MNLPAHAICLGGDAMCRALPHASASRELQGWVCPKVVGSNQADTHRWFSPTKMELHVTSLALGGLKHPPPKKKTQRVFPHGMSKKATCGESCGVLSPCAKTYLKHPNGTHSQLPKADLSLVKAPKG